MAFGIQKSTKLVIEHGFGMQRLKDIAREAGDIDTLQTRWQRMMEAFLGSQLHVLTGLGYPSSEQGLQLYNQHVAYLGQTTDPETLEKLKLGTHELWKTVLSLAFDIKDFSDCKMSVVDARNAMHKLAMKMQEPETLELIAEKCAKLESSGNPEMDMAMKNMIIQDTLLNNVYFAGEPSLVEDLGFPKGEAGYVYTQLVMVENQDDPLVAQYIGTSMQKILQSAGIDTSAVKQAAEGMKSVS